MFKKFRNKIGNFDDRPLEEIMRHLDRLGITIAFIAGAVAIGKFSDQILPACPFAVKVLGFLLVIFAGIPLLVAISFGAWAGVTKLDSGRSLSHFVGLLFFLIVILVGVGGIYAALPNQ